MPPIAGTVLPQWTFHVTPWERAFLEKIASARSTIRIACPFIKLRNIRLILASITSPVSLKVITRLNVRDCLAHVHDLSAVQLLMDNPISDKCTVDIRVDNALHAKLYIIDDTEAIVTSSNLTYSGFYRNLEVALSTSRDDTVQVAADHFETLFRNARSVDQSSIDDVRCRLRSLPPAPSDDPLPDISPLDQTSGEELDTVAFDQQSIEAIDSNLTTRLEEEIRAGFGAFAPFDSAERLSENRFWEDMQQRFAVVFGPPIPTPLDLATIYVHSSAYPQVHTTAVDTNVAGKWVEMGKYATVAVISLLVFEGSLGKSDGEGISTKTSYIAQSDHLMRRLDAYGLMRAIVGKGVLGANPDTSAMMRGTWTTAQAVAARIIAYLFRTRSWEDFLASLRKILMLAEEFPYESYRSENYKSRLQQASQERYDSVPEYRLVGREGPDHDAWFRVAVYVGKKRAKLLAEGAGRTKKLAETDAAYKALACIAEAGFGKIHSGSRQPLPEWIVEKCSTEGQYLLKNICGKALPKQINVAILVPSRCQDRTGIRIRSALAAVGGRVRGLMVHTAVADVSPTYQDLTQRVSFLNKNSRLVAIFLGTPIGSWLRSLSSSIEFQDACEPRSVIDTINAFIGGVFVEYGFEACRPLQSMFFASADIPEPGKIMSARSKLQQVIQGAVKGRYQELIDIRTKALHKPSEAHSPRFEVTILLGGVEIGRESGGNKKEAIERAARKALDAPNLASVLERFTATNTDEKRGD